MSGYSGNQIHDNNVYLAEVALQAAMKGSPTQAQANTASIAYHRAVMASAKANGIGFAVNAQALRELTGSYS